MKRIAVLIILMTGLHMTLPAQITGITPNTAVQGDTLHTTISAISVFMSSSSPQGNIQDIIFQNSGGNTVDYADSMRVIDSTTATAFWAIPNNMAAGVYSLVVHIYDAITQTVTAYPLNNSFTVTASPDTLVGISPVHGYQGQSLHMVIRASSLFHIGAQHNGNITAAYLQNPTHYYAAILDSTRVFNSDSASTFWCIPGTAPTGQYSLTVYIYNPFTQNNYPYTLSNCLTVDTNTGIVTSISPNMAYQGEALHTTITTNDLYMSSSSPQGNIQDIILKNSIDSVFAIIDSTHIQNPDTAVALWNIPATIDTGFYSLFVRIYNSVSQTVTDFSLSNSFHIMAAAATVSGTVYEDMNHNGTRDLGEPGLPGFMVRLSASGNVAVSDSNGHYILGSLPGADTIRVLLPEDDVYGYSGSSYHALSIMGGSNTGPDFGMAVSRFLVSVSPAIDTFGQQVHLSITDSIVLWHSIIVSVVARYPGSPLPTYCTGTSAPDSAHIGAFLKIPLFSHPGMYDLIVTVRDTLTGHTRSFMLDTAIKGAGPIGAISGYAYIDSNGNGVKDPGEPGQAGMYAYIYGPGFYHSTLTDSNGYYSVTGLPNGAYYTNMSNPYAYYYYNCGTGNLSYTPYLFFDTIVNNTFSNQNFGSPPPGNADFDIEIWPMWRSANPGFIKHYAISYFNNSPISAVNAVITFQYDSTLVYDSSSRAPSVINTATHTLTWNVDTLAPYNYYGGYDDFDVYLSVPLSDTAGRLLSSIFSISPVSGDCSPVNNTVNSISPVTSSYDPNEKYANPYSRLIYGKDSVIDYTINFQNTGTAPTHFVVIRDTLDPSLDPKTVVLIGGSGHCTLDNNVGALTFTFDPLTLTDSATDEPRSHGYVSYRVKLKSGLPLGTVVRNKGYIYFDYNQPIATNTTTNTIISETGIKDINGDRGVKVIPNPFTESTTISFANPSHDKFVLTVYDIDGQVVRRLESDSQFFDVDRGSLTPGVYIFGLVNQKTKQSLHGKLSVN